LHVSKDPVLADISVYARPFHIVSPPFNPSSVNLDDLIKAHESCTHLIVAFDIGSYSTFMPDFASWLNSSTHKSAMLTTLLANIPPDGSIRNVPELSAWAASLSMKLFEVNPKTGDGTNLAFDAILSAVDNLSLLKSKKESQKSHRTTKSDMGTTPDKKSETRPKKEREEDEVSTRTPKSSREKMSQSRPKLTESSEEHEHKKIDKRDREKSEKEGDRDKKERDKDKSRKK
jgi:hypothetical protein